YTFSYLVIPVSGKDGAKDVEVISQIQDLSGRLVQYSYDENAALKQVTDVRGKNWQYLYSGGRLAKKLDPKGNMVSFQYTAKGLVKSIADDLGVRETYSYSYDSDQIVYHMRKVLASGAVEETWVNGMGMPTKSAIDGNVQ